MSSNETANQKEVARHFEWITEQFSGVSPDVALQAAVEMIKSSSLDYLAGKIDKIAEKIDYFTNDGCSVNVQLRTSSREPINLEISQPIRVDIDN